MSAAESEEELTVMLNKLEKEAKGLKSKLAKNESKSRKRISNLVEMAELMIESYRLEYAKKDEDCKSKSKKFHSTLDQIKSSIERTINQYFGEIKEKKGKKKPDLAANEMDGTELIQLGDEMQDDGIERLLQMNKDMDLNKIKVDDINQNLLTQNEKMMATEEEVKDIQSTLKRAKLIIMYFSEEFYKDKCVRILILLIILVLIAICVTIFVKKKKK